MYSAINGYKSAQSFAKTYRNKKGKPVSRQYIYELINREKSQPDTTDIDVVEVDGSYFVRLRPGRDTVS